jgi:MoaA/NifB/PqqE/SkfB family radical SAM enzyme
MEENTRLLAQNRTARYRQKLKSVPHYLKELGTVRNPRDLYSFLQFKLPYLFPIPAFPPRIQLELTNHCNFSCRYCHRGVMNREIGTIEFELLQKIVTEISMHRNSVLKIVGLGEPSLYPRCDEFMRSLRDRSINCVFYTNGSLLQLFKHDQILAWQIPHLVISIDGIDRQSYEHQRVGGNYDQLREALQAFHRRRTELGQTKPMIEVRHVILPQETDTQLADFKKTWMRVADTVMFNRMEPAGPLIDGVHPPAWRCRDIRREMYVRWNGKVPACGYDYLVSKQRCIADIHDSTIRDAWHHNMVNQLRSSHLRGDSTIPSFCGVCCQVA